MASMPELENRWVALPKFTGTDPIGWVTKAEKLFEILEIPSFNKLWWAFMRMEEGVALHWFISWYQEYPNSDWNSFSIALIRNFGEIEGGSVAEGLLKEEAEALNEMKKDEENSDGNRFEGPVDEESQSCSIKIGVSHNIHQGSYLLKKTQEHKIGETTLHSGIARTGEGYFFDACSETETTEKTIEEHLNDPTTTVERQIVHGSDKPPPPLEPPDIGALVATLLHSVPPPKPSDLNGDGS